MISWSKFNNNLENNRLKYTARVPPSSNKNINVTNLSKEKYEHHQTCWFIVVQFARLSQEA